MRNVLLHPLPRWAGSSGIHLPLETEEAQKDEGSRLSTSRNPLNHPHTHTSTTARLPRGSAKVSEGRGAKGGGSKSAAGKQELSYQSLSGEAAFYGRY